MNSLQSLNPPPSSKNTSPANSLRSSSLKRDSQDAEPFESKLKETDQRTQDPQVKEVNETQEPLPIEEIVEETPTTTTPLFPQQMTIQSQISPQSQITPQNQSTTATEESNDLGNIFHKSENNSNKPIEIDHKIENLFKDKVVSGKTISSTSEIPTIDLGLTPQTDQVTPDSLTDKATINVESKVLELIKQSVADQPLPVTDLDPSLQRPLHLDLPPASLKEFVGTSKNESIHLSSQHHLDKVLESTFEENPLPTPRRIEVKLETPQGSQVTLYIARVNQELRAQFSANNVLAFQWLQKEISQLKSLQTGEYVRWLPAQIDAGITKTQGTSKNSQDNLKGDREKEGHTPLESLFDFFKPSTRRIA